VAHHQIEKENSLAEKGVLHQPIDEKLLPGMRGPTSLGASRKDFPFERKGKEKKRTTQGCRNTFSTVNQLQPPEREDDAPSPTGEEERSRFSCIA